MSIADIIDSAIANPQGDAHRVCGVYVIVNTHTRAVYVGQSKDIKGRWSAHKSALDAGRHSNKRLQSEWRLYGGQLFRFHVVLMGSPTLALAREKALTVEALGGDCYNHSAAACPGRNSSSGEAMQQKTIRLPPSLWDKIDMHGLNWLRDVVKRAKAPK
jgi:predicted GIY-YIG superfamily endonuclease